MTMKSPYPMVSIETAQNAIIDALQALPSEEVKLSEAHGRVLRADVQAPHDLPTFTASLKDGYAVVSTGGEAGKRLMIRSDLASHATQSDATAAALPPPLLPGEAAYIATGAPLPSGADAVAMIEVCRIEGTGTNSTVTMTEWPKSGLDVRRAGSDAQAGETLLEAGCELRAGEIGLLAGAGVESVEVTRRVRVGVLSTGDELALVGKEPLGRGGVHDANRPMLLALLTEHCNGMAIGVDLGVVRDDESAVQRKLSEAREQVDVLITTGGVSMGAKDYIKPTLANDSTLHFGRVNMKPGKPLSFATYTRHECVVALPGNPVSAFVCFHVAALRAVRTLAGIDANALANATVVDAILAHDFKRDRIRPEFHRAQLEWCSKDGIYKATSTGKQASSRLLSVRHADAFVLLPSGDRAMAEGTKVTAQMLR